MDPGTIAAITVGSCVGGIVLVATCLCKRYSGQTHRNERSIDDADVQIEEFSAKNGDNEVKLKGVKIVIREQDGTDKAMNFQKGQVGDPTVAAQAVQAIANVGGVRQHRERVADSDPQQYNIQSPNMGTMDRMGSSMVIPYGVTMRIEGRNGEHVLGPGDTHLVRDLQAYLRQWGTAFAESMYQFSARTITSAVSPNEPVSFNEEAGQAAITRPMHHSPVMPLSVVAITGQKDDVVHTSGGSSVVRDEDDDEPRLPYWRPLTKYSEHYPTAPKLQGHSSDPFHDE